MNFPLFTYTFRLHLGGHEPPNERSEDDRLAAAGRKDDKNAFELLPGVEDRIDGLFLITAKFHND